MKKLTKNAVIGLLLPLLSTAAIAQTALTELRLQAGDDAVAVSQKIEAVAAAPQVNPETTAKLQAKFRALRDQNFPGIEWKRMSLGVRYVRVPLQTVSCPGCVSYTALLPIGALTPTAPVGDPNKASYFIIERSGEWIKPESAFSAPIAMPAHDIFAQCADVDALNIRAWSLPEAVAHTQACLNKTYNQNPTTRRIYFVSAAQAKFSVRACPENAPRTCNAIMLVDGVQITVSGRVPAADSVLSDIGFALSTRHGKLYGFHAVLDNKSEVLP